MPHSAPCILDDRLSGLGAALDPRFLQTALGEVDGFPRGTRVLGVQLLKHKRGRRCSLAYSVETTRRRSRLFGKTFGNERGRSVHEKHAALHAATADSAEVSVPAPLVYLPSLRMALTEFVDGLPAADALYGPRGCAAAERIAAALFALHGSGARLDRRWRVEDELRATDRQLRALPAGSPERSRAARLRAELDRTAVGLPSAEPAPIHRDFYPEQVLDAGGRTYLIDLDDAAMGDPAVDLGNFVAHLQLRALQFPRKERACAAARVAFLHAYLGRLDARANDAGLRARVRFHEAATLVRLAGVYAARPRWAAALPSKLLDAAEALLR